MKAVILLGGESSRFFPFNNYHKSLRVIAGKSILLRTLESVAKSGIKEVVLINNSFDDVKGAISGFEPKGLKITYRVQKEPLGMANAILSAEDLLDGDFFVINASHFDFHKVKPLFEKQKSADRVLVGGAVTDEPWKYGMLKIKDGKVSGVVEKPKPGKEPSNIRIVGVYKLNTSFLKEIKKLPTTQYQLELALAKFAKVGKLDYVSVEPTPPLKYAHDLFAVKDHILSETKPRISPKATISKTAIVEGDVVIEDGAKIYEFAIVKGPCYIGKNAVVGAYCSVRSGSCLEEGVAVQRYADIKNSIMFKNASIHSGFIGDSIIGEEVDLGAGFITANKRFDNTPPKITLPNGERVSTGIRKFGCLIGDNTTAGIYASTMPGTVVSSGSVIFPSEMVKGIK